MPVQLLGVALSRLRLPHAPRTLSPRQAYLLSLELGSSYAATVTQLEVLGRLDTGCARELRRQSVLAIKTALAGGQVPEDPRADVWLLSGESANRRHINVRIGDEVHLLIEAAHGESLAPALGPQLELIDDRAGLDSRTCRRFVLRATAAGRVNLALSGSDATRLHLAVKVRAAPSGNAPHGLTERQHPLLFQRAKRANVQTAGQRLPLRVG